MLVPLFLPDLVAVRVGVRLLAVAVVVQVLDVGVFVGGMRVVVGHVVVLVFVSMGGLVAVLIGHDRPSLVGSLGCYPVTPQPVRCADALDFNISRRVLARSVEATESSCESLVIAHTLQ